MVKKRAKKISLKKKVAKGTSWEKIILVILAGIIIGLLLSTIGVTNLNPQELINFVTLTLLTCVLALLLDIRQMIISCN